MGLLSGEEKADLSDCHSVICTQVDYRTKVMFDDICSNGYNMFICLFVCVCVHVYFGWN